MPLKTKHFQLDFFTNGDPYLIDLDKNRFVTIDTQLSSVLKYYSPGIIKGFDTVKTSTPLLISVSEGIAIIPFYIYTDVKNDTTGEIERSIEESRIAVRSYQTQNIEIEPNSYAIVYLKSIKDPNLSDIVVVEIDYNSIRDAYSSASVLDKYLKEYTIEGTGINPDESNITVLVNGRKYTGRYILENQIIKFENKKLDTDSVQVKVIPKDALLLSEIETNSTSIVNVDTSVKIFASTESDGATIPEGILKHDHAEETSLNEFSLSKVNLTKYTKIVSGIAVSQENETAYTIYQFQKIDINEASGFIEDELEPTFRATSGTITQEQYVLDEIINIESDLDEDVNYAGYFINPDITQQELAKVIQKTTTGVITNKLLTDIVVFKEETSAEYNYIIYPYEIIIYINGIRQYAGFRLIYDNQSENIIKIKFDNPLNVTDDVKSQLVLINELSQIKGLLNIDGLGTYSNEDLNVAFSASNVNYGYFDPDYIPRVSHIGRSKELLIPLPTEDEEITIDKEPSIINCYSTDLTTYKPGFKDFPPLKNTIQIENIDSKWFILTNNTLCLSEEQERLFSAKDIKKIYREDYPIPIKIDYCTEDNNDIALILSSKTLFKYEDDKLSTKLLASDFTVDLQKYKDYDLSNEIFDLSNPCVYFRNLIVDHETNNIFISSTSDSELTFANTLHVFANKTINDPNNSWAIIFSSEIETDPTKQIKNFIINNHTNYDGVYLLLKDSSDYYTIQYTKTSPINILASSGANLTVSAADALLLSVGNTILISQNSGSYISSYTITAITSNIITIDKQPEIQIDIDKGDIICIGWNSATLHADFGSPTYAVINDIYSYGGKIYLTSGKKIYSSNDILTTGDIDGWTSNNTLLGSVTVIYYLYVLDNIIYVSTDDGIYYYESSTWTKIVNTTYDTYVNSKLTDIIHIKSFEYATNYDEFYLSSDSGVYQLEHRQCPYVPVRATFPIVGVPIQVQVNQSISDNPDSSIPTQNNSNVFLLPSATGIVIDTNTTTNVTTVKCDLSKTNAGDTLIFDSVNSGINFQRKFRILSIEYDAGYNLRNTYKLRLDPYDGKYTKTQKIKKGDTFRIYRYANPLIFINNNPQSENYNKYYNTTTFNYQTQEIIFNNALTYTDSVTAISYLKHFYALRGTWSDTLNSEVRVFINNKYISNISGTWSKIYTSNYYEFNENGKNLVNEIVLETNKNYFYGFNLSGLEITPNILNAELKYTIQSNTPSTIRIRTEDSVTDTDAILTNPTTLTIDSISGISFNVKIINSVNNSFNSNVFGEIGLITLPSPVLPNSSLKITIPNTSTLGNILGSGSYTHKEIDDAFSTEETGLSYGLSGILNSNVAQFIREINKLSYSIENVKNIEISDLTIENSIDLVNSTIENTKEYEFSTSGEYSQTIFGLLYSADLGGLYAITDNGVYVKESPENTYSKWKKKTNIVKYMSVSGQPTVASETIDGVYVGYNKDTEKWTLKWGKSYKIDTLNNGLDNLYITCLDIDITDTDEETIFIGTNKNGAYKSTDGGDSWSTLFNPGAFDANNNTNTNAYKVSAIKAFPSKPNIISILIYDKDKGGLYISNDNGSNFRKYEYKDPATLYVEEGTSYDTDSLLLKITFDNAYLEKSNYYCLAIPHIDSVDNVNFSGLSPVIYWGSDAIYRKQYGKSVFNKSLDWIIEKIPRIAIDNAIRDDFTIKDIAIDTNDISNIFISTSNGLYRNRYDSTYLTAYLQDASYLIDSTWQDHYDETEYPLQTKYWITFKNGIVPTDLLIAGNYYKLKTTPLKLISYTDEGSGNIIAIFDSYDPFLTIAGALGQLFTNTKNNELNKIFLSTWEKIGITELSTMSITKILFHNDILYVGTNGYGIYSSANNGDTFTELNTGFAELLEDGNLNISDIQFDENNNIYCSSRDFGNFGGGVFKLVGNSWTRIGGTYTGTQYNCTITDGLASHDITCFKVRDNTLYAGTSAGLYKSINGGTAWTRVSLPGEFANIIHSLSDGNNIILGSKHIGILRTKNKGGFWFQDFQPNEEENYYFNNPSIWRVYDLKQDIKSTDYENNLYINVFTDKYITNILGNTSIDTLKLYTSKNSNSNCIEFHQDNSTSEFEYITSNKKTNMLEVLLYNQENQSILSNLTIENAVKLNVGDSTTEFGPSEATIEYYYTKATNSIQFKECRLKSNFRRAVSLLLDHEETLRFETPRNSVLPLLHRRGIYFKDTNYNINHKEFKKAISNTETLSGLSDYNISDIIIDPSVSEKYYIATENHGVFSVTNLIATEPAHYLCGQCSDIQDNGFGQYTITDPNTNFDALTSPTDYKVVLQKNTDSFDISGPFTVTGVSGHTIDISGLSPITGIDYFYTVYNTHISQINTSTTSIWDAIRNPTIVSENVITDSITVAGTSGGSPMTVFGSNPTGKKFYMHLSANGGMHQSAKQRKSMPFVVDDYSSLILKFNRKKIYFKDDLDTLYIDSIEKVTDDQGYTYAAINLAYPYTYNLSESYFRSFDGLLIKFEGHIYTYPVAYFKDERTIYIRDCGSTKTNHYISTFSTGGIFSEINPEFLDKTDNVCKTCKLFYSVISFNTEDFFKSSEFPSNSNDEINLVEEKTPCFLLGNPTFTQIDNNSLTNYYSEFKDDNDVNEIDLKFNKLLITSSSSLNMYAATELGVFKCDYKSGSPTWDDITAGQLTNYSVKTIEGVYDTVDILFIATFGGGIYRSIDSGTTWTNIFNVEQYNKIWDIAIDPSDLTHATIVIGTKDGAVFRTTNALDSNVIWDEFSDGIDRSDIFDWKVKGNANVLYSYSYGGGVFKSIDNGENWTCINTGLTNKNVTDLDVLKSDETGLTVIISTDGGGLFKYSNNRWHPVWYNFIPHSSIGRVRFGADDSEIIFIESTLPFNDSLINEQSYSKGAHLPLGTNPVVYLSEDGGKSWTNIFEGESGIEINIEVSDDDKLIITKGNFIRVSSNHGKTFETITQLIDLDDGANGISHVNVNTTNSDNINIIAPDPHFQSSRIYISTDCGETFNDYSLRVDRDNCFEIYSEEITKFSTTPSTLQTITISKVPITGSILSISASDTETIINCSSEIGGIGDYSDFGGYEINDIEYSGATLTLTSTNNVLTYIVQPQNKKANDSGKSLKIDANLSGISLTSYTLTNVYSVVINVASDDNYKINNSLIGKYIKINSNVYKICYYNVSSGSATIYFVGNPTSTTALNYVVPVTDLANTNIEIGSAEYNETTKVVDIKNLNAIYFISTENKLCYTLNEGLYVVENPTITSVSALTTDNNIYGVVEGWTHSSKDYIFMYLQGEQINKVYYSNGYKFDSPAIIGLTGLTSIETILNNGLAKSYGLDKRLFVSTSTNIYRTNEITATTFEEVLIPTITEIQKPLSVSKQNSDYGIFVADDKLYITNNLLGTTTWENKDISVGGFKLTANDIEFIRHTPVEGSGKEQELLLSVNVREDKPTSINGLYLSSNNGGKWSKLKFYFYGNEDLQKTNNIVKDIQIDGDRTFISIINDGIQYTLSNINGLLGNKVNGVFKSNNLEIISTVDGLTFKIPDNNKDNTKNQFDYRFYIFPLEFFIGTPKSIYFNSSTNKLFVGTPNGLQTFDVSIINGKLSLPYSTTYTSNLISPYINKIIPTSTNGIIVGTQSGITIFSDITNLSVSESIDFSIYNTNIQSNNVIDLIYISDESKIIAITKDSIFTIKTKESSTPNIIRTEETLTSIGYKKYPYINIKDEVFTAYSINQNISKFSNILITKTITYDSAFPIYNTNYITPISATILTKEFIESTNKTRITIGSLITINNSTQQIIGLLDTSNPTSEFINATIESSTTTSTAILLDGDRRAQIVAGTTKVFLTNKLSNKTYIVYNGTSNSFVDNAKTTGVITYGFYYKLTDGKYLKFYSYKVTDITEDVKSYKLPYVFIGSTSRISTISLDGNSLETFNNSISVNNITKDDYGNLFFGLNNSFSNFTGIFRLASTNLEQVKIGLNNDDTQAYTIDGIFYSNDKLFLSYNNSLLECSYDNSFSQVVIVQSTMTQETSYSTLFSDNYIANLNIRSFSEDANAKLSLYNDSLFIFANQQIIKTTSNFSSIIRNNLLNQNNSGQITKSILYLSTINSDADVEGIIDYSIICDGENVYCSDINGLNYFSPASTINSTTINSTTKLTRVYKQGTDIFLSTNNYLNKIIKLDDITLLDLSASTAGTILNGDDGLRIQDIYSIKYNSGGTELWAGGFRHLYWRDKGSNWEDPWTRIDSSYLTDHYEPMPLIKYKKILITKYATDLTDHAIIIGDQINLSENITSRISGKGSIVLRAQAEKESGDYTGNFIVNLMSSGFSAEVDPGRFEQANNAGGYPIITNQYIGSKMIKFDQRFAFFSPEASSEEFRYTNYTYMGFPDVNINGICEATSGNTFIIGSNQNNLRHLICPRFNDILHTLPRNLPITDTSIRLGYTSYDETHSLGTGLETGTTFISNSIPKNYKPVRSINVFSSIYDEDKIFVSVFNPADLSTKTFKDNSFINNEKALDHDYGYLLMSNDGGVSWQRIGHSILPKEAIISAVEIDGLNNIYVGVFGSKSADCKVYMSTDNGKTFTDISGGLPNSPYYPIKSLLFIDNVPGFPEYGGTLYAGLWGKGIYKLNISEYGYGLRYGYGYGYGIGGDYFDVLDIEGYLTGYGANGFEQIYSWQYGWGYGYEYGYGYETTFFDVINFNFANEDWQELNYEIGYKKGKNLLGSEIVGISSFRGKSNEIIWVATEDDGVLYSTGSDSSSTGKSFVQKNNGLLTKELTSILCSPSNEDDVWIGTETGFYKFNFENQKWDLISNGISATSNITKIECDKIYKTTYVPLNFQTPADVLALGGGTVVLRSKNFIYDDAPENGPNRPVAGNKIGNSTVVYVGDGDYSVTPYNDQSKNLDIGAEYYYSFYSYVLASGIYTFTIFPSILKAELNDISDFSPNTITVTNLADEITGFMYFDLTTDKHYGYTAVLLGDKDAYDDTRSFMETHYSILGGYQITFNYGAVNEVTKDVVYADPYSVFINGDITAELSLSTPDFLLYPNIDNDAVVGYALNPNTDQLRTDDGPDKLYVYQITSSTKDTITVDLRNDGLKIPQIGGLNIKTFKFVDGTEYTGDYYYKDGKPYAGLQTDEIINTQENDEIYDASQAPSTRALIPIYGPLQSFFESRLFNYIEVLSNKKIKSLSIIPLYVGTTQGLYKSINNGISFTYLSNLGTKSINDVKISIENINMKEFLTDTDAVVYASTTVGLFKSTDGGTNWNQIGVSVFGSNPVGDMIISYDELGREIIYIDYIGSGLYKSIDHGVEWNAVDGNATLSLYTINDIDSYSNLSNAFVLSTDGNGIIYYKEPNNEPFNITIKTDTSINTIENIETQLGDEIITLKDRVIINSKIRNSNVNRIKRIDFESDSYDGIEVSSTYEGLLIDKDSIYIGDTENSPTSNPFKLNSINDDQYPTHMFKTKTFKNNIYVGTNRGGYITKDSAESWFKSGDYSTPSIVYDYDTDTDGTIYIATNNGVWKSTDDGETFQKDQLIGTVVRTIWSINSGPIRRQFIGSDSGLRIYTRGAAYVQVTTPETFSANNGISLSWGGIDSDGNQLIGGMPKELLDFLNKKRVYEIPGLSGEQTSSGFAGILISRYEGTTPNNFTPTDDCQFDKGYRRYIEPGNNSQDATFEFEPSVRPFKKGHVIADNILNTNIQEKINADGNYVSDLIISGEKQNTFTPDNPWIDKTNATENHDKTHTYGAYTGLSGTELETAYAAALTTVNDEFKNATLRPETTYQYDFFTYYTRPTIIPYFVNTIGQHLNVYSKFIPKEYTVNIKMANIPNATQILCGDCIDADEFVFGTDDGAFYGYRGNGIKKSLNTDNRKVFAIKAILTGIVDYGYGYGYGYGEGSDYFDVLDIEGYLTGYGANGFEELYDWQYGWGYGYELIPHYFIFAGLNDGIYLSTNKGISYSKIYDTTNSNIDIIYCFEQDNAGVIYAGTNAGLLVKSTINNTDWVLEPIIGSADYLAEDRIIGQTVKLET